jgi:DNA-binding NarL/FixJ family response regulator
VLDAVLGSFRQLFSWTESSTALMTAAAVATLTSGNEQRYAETAAVLAIAVGAVCVRMASAAWLLADGLWVCGHLRAAGLATRALVLTMYDDVTVLAALRAGRTATHSRSRTERDRRRRTVSARGEALFGAGIAARMLQHFGRAATSSPFPELTEGETEVLGLLAAGPGQRWGREALAGQPQDGA